MTTLDARARNAAHSIRAGVAEFTPAASFDVVVVRQQRWRTLRAGFAGAAAALAIVFAGIAITPTPTPEVADTPTTIVEPTVPPPAPEVIAPIVPETTDAPDRTTTTTTTAPVTTTTQGDTTPPHLEITAPKSGERFEVDIIEFRGVTEPGATVFAGQYEADVDGDGNWSIVLVLSPGANGARFVATDAAGNQAEARVTVYYDVPKTTTTTKAPKEEIKFTAYNVYGSCEETPPYDVYWGTAPPGTPIYIESAYGSGSTTANAGGDWEVKVFFPEAPAEKVFTVKVKDDTGQKFYFEFIHYV